jgi:LysM repeat protein
MTYHIKSEASQGVSIINVRTVPLLVVLSLIALGAFVWVVSSSSARAAASAPASAASAAASAPARAVSIPPLSAFQPKTQAAAPAQPASAPARADQKTYPVKHGDTLSQVFGSQWKQVCQANHLKHCDRLEPGQELQLPEGITPREVKPVARAARALKDENPKAAQAAAVRQASVTNAAGEILYRRVGTAPLNGCGQRDIMAIAEEAWSVLGLSQDDRAWLRLNIDQKNGPRLGNAPQGIVQLVPGVRLERVTFCRQGKVVSVGPMRTAWSKDEAVYGEKFVLPSGKTLVWMRNCFNWVPWVPEEQPQPTSPAPEPRQPAPEPEPRQPAPEPEPIQPPPATPTTSAPRSVCDHLDPTAVLGREHEPEQNGADSHSTFFVASLYCLKPFQAADGKTGVHGYGAKVNYSDWHGSVNNGSGHYQGWNALVGPSYKRVMDDGYDWEVSAGVGKQVEAYREAAYASRREFDLVGITAGYNDYRRRLAGETWDVERQYFGALTLPIGKKVGHTIFGQSIADTAELGRFNFGVQAGARWWFYENTEEFPLLPYLQGGVFVQHPTSASMSLRLGVADENRVVGCGAGFDQDLMHGGQPVAAAGCWIDLVKGVNVARTKVRKHQVITDAAARGITIEERGGFVQVIRFGEPTE